MESGPPWSPNVPKSGFGIWKSRRSLSHLLSQGMSWTVGNGKAISLFYDSWPFDHPIALILPHLNLPPKLKESQLIENGAWKLDPALHPDVISCITPAIRSAPSPVVSMEDSPL